MVSPLPTITGDFDSSDFDSDDFYGVTATSNTCLRCAAPIDQNLYATELRSNEPDLEKGLARKCLIPPQPGGR